jgi:hypothetical protein
MRAYQTIEVSLSFRCPKVPRLDEEIILPRNFVPAPDDLRLPGLALP